MRDKFKAILTRNVFFAGLVSLFMDISSEMVYPLVPLFLTGVLGASKTSVGVIEGIAEATASVLKVFSGYISDKFGKRKLLMALGYAISALSRPLMAQASGWTEVLAARFQDRVGKGVRTAPRDAIIADSTRHEDLGTAFGFHRMMDSVGAAIGPAIAFVILLYYTGNVRLVFYASTVPAVIAVVLIAAFIREKKDGEARSRRLPSLALMRFDGAFRRYLVVIAVFSLGNFADAFIVLRAESLGVERSLIPVVYLAYNVVYALSAVPLGVAADKAGLKPTVLAGLLLYSAVFAMLALASSPLHIWVLFPLYGIYKGMSDGTQRAYLAKLAPEANKATAFGLYHAVSGFMLLPASIIAGALWDWYGPAAAFIFGAALSLAAAIIFASGWRKDAA